MTVYVITGKTFSATRFTPPFSTIAQLELGVGQTVNLTLSPTDEATLINAGVIMPQDWTIHHTILG